LATPAIFDSALAGIRTAQAGMLATSENIAGANVDGYVRRAPSVRTYGLSPNNIDLTGTAFAVEGFSRFFDSHLQSQLLAQQSNSARSRTVLDTLSVLDSMLTDPATSLAPSLGSFFNAAGSLANEPSNVSFKQALLGSARQLADGIRQIAGELDRIRKNATQGLADALNEANTLAPQLAEINVRIRGSSAPGVTPTPEILDERDRLTSRLQELVGGATRITPAGAAVLSLDGMVLVDEANANSFATREGLKPIPGGVEPTDLRLQIATDKNGSPILTPLVLPLSIQSVDNRPIAIGPNLMPPQFLNSGIAGGYLSVLTDFLPENERILDLLAGKLLFDVNRTEGVNGVTSSPLFELKSATDGSVNDSPASLNDIFLNPDGTEYTFEELLSRTHPRNSEYQVAIANKLSELVDASSFFAKQYFGSANQLSFDATAAKSLESLRGSFSGALATYVSSTSSTLAGWARESAANDALLSSLTAQKESLSGVSLDEEAANLIKYQQIYNASSKVLQVSRQLFDTLFSMLT